MYRRDKQARLLTGGLIGASSGTTGRRGVGSVASGSPPITNSAYFDATSDYMTFTPASNGDQLKWTLSFWVKKAIQDAQAWVWGAGDDPSAEELSYIQLGKNSDNNAFNFLWRDGSSDSRYLQTTAPFPTGVWTHVVMAFDAANAAAADRLKVYIDGSLITSFSSDSRSTLSGSSSPPMNAADRHAIGVFAYNLAKPGTSSAIDLADMHFIDGQVLSAADFGEDVSGTWSAKAYSGTYGSNGYHLNFTDGNNLGTDNSGNGNDWTEVSLTTSNQVAVTTSDIPQVIPGATPLRTRGYIGAAPAGSGGMLTLYDRYIDNLS